MKWLIFCVAVTLAAPFLTSHSISQKPREFKASDISGPVPVVFGSKDDGLPEEMLVRGTIQDLTFNGTTCGYRTLRGTLRVRLQEKIADYPHKDVFIVVGCFPDFERFGHRDWYIDKSVELTVSKLYPEYRFGFVNDVKKAPCAFGLITNEIDSKKVPFYCTNAEILSSVKMTAKKDKNNHPVLHW